MQKIVYFINYGASDTTKFLDSPVFTGGKGVAIFGHMTSAVREFHLYLVTTRLRGLPSDLIGWIGEKYYF